ncbi:hypothetical protein [Polymorphospora rubra]|uniref:Uncharacterized protein n=1 Tax=Polymorphospora rubra TaxID=338584 RepID=A0A810MZ59_9ACTN|nr:hypothetical protein [Polymorphospora rubra]BCJ66446.1 hypothetical protein Prubr_34670 [Polymorphospora rubra]
MTDDAPTTGSAGTTPADTGRPAPGSRPATPDGGPADRPRRRRRLWIGLGAGLFGVLVLAMCAGTVGLAAVVGRTAGKVERATQGHDRVRTACLELETRLNRLSPPGAAPTPQRRATAIRDENAAVRPFLAELDELHQRRDGADPDDHDDDDRYVLDDRSDWDQGWLRLIDARVAYADALDRQAASGEPAFFIAPRTSDGEPVVDRLTAGPPACSGAVRRLAAPDL